MHETKLVVVQRFGTRVEAELARSMLEAASIDAMIQGDTAGGMREHLAWSSGGFRLLVREEDAEAARDGLNPDHSVDAPLAAEDNVEDGK